MRSVVLKRSVGSNNSANNVTLTITEIIPTIKLMVKINKLVITNAAINSATANDCEKPKSCSRRTVAAQSGRTINKLSKMAIKHNAPPKWTSFLIKSAIMPFCSEHKTSSNKKLHQ